MTKQELIEALDTLKDTDPEGAHQQADTLLIEWLSETEPDIATAWSNAEQRIGFWYA